MNVYATYLSHNSQKLGAKDLHDLFLHLALELHTGFGPFQNLLVRDIGIPTGEYSFPDLCFCSD